jgi:hypothetical protein
MSSIGGKCLLPLRARCGMSTIKDSDIEQHVTILGWLYVIGNALLLMIAAFVFVLLTSVGLAVPDPVARSTLPVIGPAVGLLLAALALPGLAPGYGLVTRKPWARVLAIVVGILGLLNFPIGTAIGLYSLWILVPSRVANYFDSAARAPV